MLVELRELSVGECAKGVREGGGDTACSSSTRAPSTPLVQGMTSLRAVTAHLLGPGGTTAEGTEIGLIGSPWPVRGVDKDFPSRR